MLAYIMVGSNNLKRSAKFYDAALAPLGLVKTGGDNRYIGYGPKSTPDKSKFYVTKPYSSYKLFVTADSSKSATYPVEAYLKFTDGSNLRVFNANIAPEPGTGGGKLVPAVPGKQVSQVNIKVGSGDNMAATGFTYRVSVQGCR